MTIVIGGYLLYSSVSVVKIGAPLKRRGLRICLNLLNAVVRIDVLETTFTAGAKRSIRSVGSGIIMLDDRREDYVLLISRDNETSVLRVGLR